MIHRAAGRDLGEPLNPAAAYFIACISGGLGGEIIGLFVNDHGFANDVRQGKSLVVEDAESIALIAKKRRQIPRVIGMGGISGIIVQSCVAEMIAAVAGFMYVHGIEIAGTGDIDVGKAEDFRFHQDTAVDGMIEFDRAARAGAFRITVDPGNRAGVVLYQESRESCFGCHFIIRHRKTPLRFTVMV